MKSGRRRRPAKAATCFRKLLPGTYSLSAEAPGFKAFVQSGIVLNANQTAEANATMQVGATGETV
ncbi:MAG TPA: carboxypeptidase-like regulatory domain-containing protein, partial [Bryobacteraceae bacterium]|nr:carboxypeptidase-like regulatory domain-containing protein [Bryobacteraceae bacterium]